MATKPAAKKINATKDYSLFRNSESNRPLDVRKHRHLEDSMKKYGFLPSFPIVCVRVNGHLEIRDGQHRFAVASKLGLAIYWVEETVDFDIAEVNTTATVWKLSDYAEMYARKGVAAYKDGLEFCKTYNLPVGRGFSILSATATFSNAIDSFRDGTFRIRDRQYAETVAGLFTQIIAIAPQLSNSRFLEACMAVCRVPEFNPGRLVQCAKNCRDKLVPYATRDACLDMIEAVYNWKRQNLFGVKAAATMAMRERNPTKNNGK